MRIFLTVIFGFVVLQATALAEITLKEGHVLVTLSDGRPFVLPKEAYEALREYESLDNAGKARGFGERAGKFALDLKEKGLELGRQWDLKTRAAELGQPYREKPTRMKRLERDVDSLSREFLSTRKAIVAGPKSAGGKLGRFGKAGIAGAAAVAGAAAMGNSEAKADEFNGEKFQLIEDKQDRSDVEIGVLE